MRIEQKEAPADDDVGGDVEEEETAEGTQPAEQLAHDSLTNLNFNQLVVRVRLLNCESFRVHCHEEHLKNKKAKVCEYLPKHLRL